MEHHGSKDSTAGSLSRSSSASVSGREASFAWDGRDAAEGAHGPAAENYAPLSRCRPPPPPSNFSMRRWWIPKWLYLKHAATFQPWEVRPYGMDDDPPRLVCSWLAQGQKSKLSHRRTTQSIYVCMHGSGDCACMHAYVQHHAPRAHAGYLHGTCCRMYTRLRGCNGNMRAPASI